MKLTELFLAEIEREAAATRKALARVPERRSDFKPHPKSMSLRDLSALVAQILSWIPFIIEKDELDINPPGGSAYRPPALTTSAELIAALDQAVEKARASLEQTSDEHLLTSWRLLDGGKEAMKAARHIMIRDTVLAHLAHHRGQLTVYLRLTDAPVPAIYGPSADERW